MTKNIKLSDLNTGLSMGGAIIALGDASPSILDLTSIKNKKIRQHTENAFLKNKVLPKR